MSRIAGIIGMAAIAWLFVTQTQPLTAQQTAVVCGHCHEEEVDSLTDEYVHQMTDAEPAFVECDGPPGHPEHDCENGDGPSWSPGKCFDRHATCGDPDLARLHSGAQTALALVAGPATPWINSTPTHPMWWCETLQRVAREDVADNRHGTVGDHG